MGGAKTPGQLSVTEWEVFHAVGDSLHDGGPGDAAAVILRLPDLHPDTVRRTRHRLAGWGLVRPCGSRVRFAGRGAPEPYAAREVSEGEAAEVEARRREVERAWVAPRLRLACSAYDVLAQKNEGREILPIGCGTPLDTICSVDAPDDVACRIFLAVFPPQYGAPTW